MSILSIFSNLFHKCDCKEKHNELFKRIDDIENRISKIEENLTKEPIYKDVEFFHGKIVITEEIFENGIVLFNDTDEEAGLYSIQFHSYNGDNCFVQYDDGWVQMYHVQIPAHGFAEIKPLTDNKYWKVGGYFDINIDYGTITDYKVIV